MQLTLWAVPRIALKMLGNSLDKDLCCVCQEQVANEMVDSKQTRLHSNLEDPEEGQGSGAHMISTASVPADQPVRIAFSLDHASDDTPPEDDTPLVFPELDQQLQPLPPCHDSMESMQVFKQHCQIAEEYREVKKEIALLEERKKELIAKLDQAEKEKLDAAQLAREFEALTEENRTLKLAQSQCVEQLEKLRIQYQKRQGSS
ncbi:MAP3K7 C-terminal-like protein isoform X1 [Camelus ferus]|uniref:MAP3K7 C-terminal-like protein isoform X1 n=12 Tax=Camelidae TaxID=9835 RepID=A0A8B8SRC8_CAMFR|nr:MAP3K7 C-terminal-like protein isoform X1 [Camelus dromedarius]XP_032332455.1 MAP3K7 C-terminal-like protein isoform X1 [Camelus ferus]